ncbi:hypothetical protein Ddc_21906 [Ditylenchus destructor]|nr:hypothetical protein Ddc_21906 [Ditylenchus destructor]
MEYVKYLNLGSDITIVVLHATTIFFTFHVIYCSKFDKKSTKLDRISNSFFIFLFSRGFGAVIATPYYVYLTVYWSAEEEDVPLSQKNSTTFSEEQYHFLRRRRATFSEEDVQLSQKRTCHFLRRTVPLSQNRPWRRRKRPLRKDHQKRARSSLRENLSKAKRRSSPRMLPDEKRLNRWKEIFEEELIGNQWHRAEDPTLFPIEKDVNSCWPECR